MEEADPTPAGLADRAREVFDAYAASLAGREAAQTLGPFADGPLDVTVAVPRTGLGWQHGAGALAAVDAWRRSLSFAGSATAVGLTLGRALGSGGTTAAFEYEFDGRLVGEPYSTHACVVFEWRPQGALVSIREYYGDNTMSPDAFEAYGLRSVFLPRPGQRIEPGKPATLSSTTLHGSDDAALLVGQRAYEAFAVSVAEGKWAPYVELMDPLVSFTLPIPGRMRGVQRGAAAAEEYHRWRWHELRMRTQLSQQSVMTNGPTVAIEFDTVGVIGPDNPLHHWAIYYFDVEADKVVGFREYNGDERQAP